MSAKRFNLGPTPHVEVGSCGGDVEVRGSAGPDTVIEVEGGPFDASSAEGGVTIGALGGGCSIRLPEGGSVAIRSIGGQVRIKGLSGQVDLGVIGGDCAARHAGGLRIERVGGDLSVRGASGVVTIGSIGGDARLRDVDGSVKVDSVGGDVRAHRVAAGLEAGSVGGDVDVKTPIAAGAVFRLAARGDVNLRVPSDSQARCVFPANSNLRLDRGLKAVSEGDSLIVLLGDGSATMEASAHGDIRLRLDDHAESDEDREMHLDDDLEGMMFDLTAQIDTHMRRVEDRLNRLPDTVRERIERRLDNAMKQVQAAERQARAAAEQHGRLHVLSFPSSRSSADQPVTDEERMAVLKMLEEGVITVDEAHKLLAALEGEEQA